MTRSVDLFARSIYSVARVHEAFGDAAYWKWRLALYAEGEPTLDALHTDSKGVTSVEVALRFGGDQLPAAMGPLRLGSVRVLHRERWWPVGDALHGEVTVAAPRTPLSGRGDVVIAPEDSGSQLTGTAKAEARVPFIGGAIARFFTGQIANGVREIVHVTDEWLDAADERSG